MQGSGFKQVLFRYGVLFCRLLDSVLSQGMSLDSCFPFWITVQKLGNDVAYPLIKLSKICLPFSMISVVSKVYVDRDFKECDSFTIETFSQLG